MEEEVFEVKNNWVCVFSGDKMCNDGYRQKKTHKFAVLAVNVPVGGTGQSDLPEFMGLKKKVFEKKADFMNAMKAYLQRISKLLKADKDKDEDDVKHFQAQATTLVKEIVGKYAEFEFY